MVDNARINAEEAVIMNVLGTERIAVVLLVGNHVKVLVTRTAHSIVTQAVRVLATNSIYD